MSYFHLQFPTLPLCSLPSVVKTMRHSHLLHSRRGITVLALLILIIVLLVVGFFLFRYLSPGVTA